MSARRPWAWPLVPLYRAGWRVEDALRRRGALKSRALGWPVVSVGSLSAGGAGKTPVVIALAELLGARGWAVDVLSRGYGGEASRRRGFAGRVGLGEERAAAVWGDEPVLIAERAGVPVWVGADRGRAGAAAERFADGGQRIIDETSQPGKDGPVIGDALSKGDGRGVHLLDDGFQHRELARSFDVVLVTAEDLGDALLPAGNLREPWAALARADAVVAREDEVGVVAKAVWPLLREGAQVWTVRRRLRFPAPLGVLTAGLRPLAFCAIARPDGFAEALKAAGCGLIDTVVFPDHAAYGERQLGEIVRFARELGASGLVTTEKDAVKLSAAARERLSEAGPLTVAALHAEFADGEAVARAIETRIGQTIGARP